MGYRERRKIIQSIIQENRVTTQEQLLQLLKERGINATQATISRDIHALNIAKVSDDHGKTYYAQLRANTITQHQRLFDAIQANVDSVTTVQFMNVIKTWPNSSYATILAGMLDESDLAEVVGTLAGTDTLITISKTNEAANAVSRMIRQHMAKH